MVKGKQYYIKSIARYSRLAKKYRLQLNDKANRVNFSQYLRLSFRYTSARKKQHLAFITATKFLTDKDLEEFDIM